MDIGYKNDELYCDGVTLQELATRYGTPFYAYSANTIERNYYRIRDAFAGLEAAICYSVKSNSNLAVLNILHQAGASFDIVSGGELERLLRIGVSGERIIFAGVGKSASEIISACQANILCFNVESEPELELISEIASSIGRTARVALRVNPDVDAGTHRHITTGTGANKFGMSIDAVRRASNRARTLKGIALDGLHCHIGSQITSTRPYTEAVGKVLELEQYLRASGHQIGTLNIGGGFGIDYRNAFTDVPTVEAYAAALAPLLSASGLRIRVEPGRAISGTSGVFVSSVLYVKETGLKRFAILDGGMNDLMRPALYDAYHEIVPVRRSAAGSAEAVYDVVGPVCESTDCFGRDRSMRPLKPGDLLAVLNAGAYCFSLSSNYNSRPRPPEILVRGGHAQLVRRRETIEDFLSFEQDSLLPNLTAFGEAMNPQADVMPCGVKAKAADFMSPAYELIGEPLNLLAGGQAWFESVYLRSLSTRRERALILGATPWLGLLCRRDHKAVCLADMSAAMLQKTARAFTEVGFSGRDPSIELWINNWLSLPPVSTPFDVVCADNSFAFIDFPGGWHNLIGYLKASIAPGGVLLSRFFAAPPKRAISMADIFVEYHGCQKVNFTEIRARLMFSQWDESSRGIDMGKVVQSFEENAVLWQPLVCGHPRNDLVTVRKYRGSGLTLYAPKLEEIVAMLEPAFDIEAVEYGPYADAPNFPLVVARRRQT